MARTTAALTEYLSATDNHDPSIDGPAKLTHVQNGAGTWTVDEGEPLDEDPDEYRVECEDCDGTFTTWHAATEHAETDHRTED